MIMDRQKTARFHSDFYRDNYYKLLRSLIVMSFIMLGLIGAIIYFILFSDPQRYYVTTTDGMIIPISPVKT